MTKDKAIQVTKTPPSNEWKYANGNMVPFSKMTDRELREAIISAESKELKYFHMTDLFAELSRKMIEEAEKRGIPIKHYDSEFTQRNVEGRARNKR